MFSEWILHFLFVLIHCQLRIGKKVHMRYNFLVTSRFSRFTLNVHDWHWFRFMVVIPACMNQTRRKNCRSLKFYSNLTVKIEISWLYKITTLFYSYSTSYSEQIAIHPIFKHLFYVASNKMEYTQNMLVSAYLNNA